MAELKKQKITCPKCKREVDINVWTKIELPYDAEQREQVLRNMLFKVGCETCKDTNVSITIWREDFCYGLHRRWMKKHKMKSRHIIID